MEQVANNAASTLGSSISSGDTTLTVADASTFPTSGNFRILIDSELILVTAVSGTTFTITRGIEGTTAASHTSGAAVTHILTAGSLIQVVTDRIINNGVSLRVMPDGTDVTVSTAQSSGNAAFLLPINLPNKLNLYGLGFQVTSSGSGTVQWGLFDYSTDPTNCTLLAGGSGALNATGYQIIPASGQPVLIQPGAYAIIVLMPSSGYPTVLRTNSNEGVISFQKYYVGYSWTNTPNLTSGWTADTVFLNLILHGCFPNGTVW